MTQQIVVDHVEDEDGTIVVLEGWVELGNIYQFHFGSAQEHHNLKYLLVSD